MNKAIIETYVGGFSVSQLNLNKEGLERLREGLDEAEKNGTSLVEDDSDTSIEITFCTEPKDVPKKKYKRTIISIYLSIFIWLGAVGLMILGILYLNDYFRSH